MMNENMDDVLQRAIEIFGNHNTAMNWLSSPCPDLGGAFPIIMISKVSGAGVVMDLLDKIADRNL